MICHDQDTNVFLFISNEKREKKNELVTNYEMFEKDRRERGAINVRFFSPLDMLRPKKRMMILRLIAASDDGTHIFFRFDT